MDRRNAIKAAAILPFLAGSRKTYANAIEDDSDITLTTDERIAELEDQISELNNWICQLWNLPILQTDDDEPETLGSFIESGEPILKRCSIEKMNELSEELRPA